MVKQTNPKKKKEPDYLTQLKYLQADFENYKKAIEKEKQQFINFANEKLIKELLTILDDFERALKTIKDKEHKQGLNLLYQNFLKILENQGLKKIESLNKEFDPYYHEAILKEKSNKDDIVLEEIQKGYLLNSKVIRHTKVKVSEKEIKKND